MPALVVRMVLILLVALVSIFGPLASAFAADAEPPHPVLPTTPRDPDGRVGWSVRVPPDTPLTVTLPRMDGSAGDLIRPTTVYSTTTSGLQPIFQKVLTEMRNMFAMVAAVGMSGWFIMAFLSAFLGDAIGKPPMTFMRIMLLIVGASLVTQLVNWGLSLGGATVPGLIVLWWRTRSVAGVLPLWDTPPATRDAA